MSKTIEKVDDVVIRFAGDSGDGMQLTGMQFTNTTALVGNDLTTLPDYPAEIRAPAGTLFGVSSFQLHFSSWDILTPGDHPGCSGGNESRCVESPSQRFEARRLDTCQYRCF